MLKEVVDQNAPIQTRGRSKKASRLRDMLIALINQVGNLEESIGNMKETLELVEGCTDGFDSMEEQLREFVLDSLGANAKKMNGLVKSTAEKLVERDDTLKDILLTSNRCSQTKEVQGCNTFE
ncbi:hypothetical protein Godav_029987 [Gossypium davidsonii]|uniref:Uncharacterized protein n=1 Tax=Gossypium davidsonii TaxID=34287 RepID=A0A7J8TJB5_GOSDV|nr:hypothetical protein [Gossypium davidsonii]